MAYQTFTDDPKTDSIKLSAEHFNELKDAINLWSSKYGNPATVTVVDAVQDDIVINTLRDDIVSTLNNINTLVTSSLSQNCSVGYSGNWQSINTKGPGGTVDANSFNKSIDDIQLLQNVGCYQCNTCDSYTPCGCDGVCNGDIPGGCTGCDGGCYLETHCTCNNLCNGNAGSKSCIPGDMTNPSLHDSCGGGCQFCGNVSGCHKGCFNAYGMSCSNCDSACNNEQPTIPGCSSDLLNNCTKCNATAYRFPWT